MTAHTVDYLVAYRRGYIQGYFLALGMVCSGIAAIGLLLIGLAKIVTWVFL